MPPLVEAAALELRRLHPAWGPRRLVVELAHRGMTPVPSESGVYRALTRAGLIAPGARHRPRKCWKRWEHGAPMELWQRDVVGGTGLTDGSTAEALTGLDDHSGSVSARRRRRHPVSLGSSRTVRPGKEVSGTLGVAAAVAAPAGGGISPVSSRRMATAAL